MSLANGIGIGDPSKIPRFPRLEKLSEPIHEVLAEFIHECSSDQATRTVATTALVLGLWQYGGEAMTSQLPSMILINATGTPTDPIDEVVKRLICDEAPLQSQAKGTTAEIPTQYASVLISQSPQAQHQDSRLISNPSRHPITRLNEEKDREAFQEHVLINSGLLQAPDVHGGQLAIETISMVVSGSLAPRNLHRDLVKGIIGLGLPICLLPHTAIAPLSLSNSPALEVFTKYSIPKSALQIGASLSLPPIDWFEHYETALRSRLRELPGTYEFSILQLVHQIPGICERIVALAGQDPKCPHDQLKALFWDLKANTIRGIVIGVTALSWYGLGFRTGCPEKKVLKLLDDLRNKGPMTKSSILQNIHLKKQERDPLLLILEAEGLITINGSKVRATTFPDFTRDIYLRTEFPEPKNIWASVTEGEKKG